MEDDILQLTKKYGTPLFVIDLDKLKENFLRFKKAFPNSVIAYSFKTNFHPEILRELNKLGAFAEVISNQEIFFAEKAGFEDNKIIFNGLGRTDEDFTHAIRKNLFSININSLDELKRLSLVSKRLKKTLEIGLRIDTEIELEYKKSFTSSKFGIKKIYYKKAKEIIKNNPFLKLKVLHSHLGTNLLDSENYVKNFKVLDKLAEGQVPYLDLGGGFASETLLNEKGASIFDIGRSIDEINQDRYQLIFEPGRYIIEDACYCTTKILSVYNKWVILDIAGNFLIPLANANYKVKTKRGKYIYNFAGNLCFSADIIQKNVNSSKLNEKEILQIYNAGAYTFSLRNNMAFPDPSIIIRKNNQFRLYKLRQSPSEIFNNITQLRAFPRP